jgi:hypothetical protein
MNSLRGLKVYGRTNNMELHLGKFCPGKLQLAPEEVSVSQRDLKVHVSIGVQCQAEAKATSSDCDFSKGACWTAERCAK